LGKACKHAEFRRELEVEAYIWQNLVIFENTILWASLRWVQTRVERVLGCVTKALYKATSRAGETVVGIDNLSTGSLVNLETAMQNPNFTFVEWDVTSPYDFDVDLILNFACPASPVHYQRTPIQTLLTSLLGTINALDLALKNGAVLVHASTSEVYGDPLVHPQPEEYFGNVNTVGERSCYDEGKRVAESLIYEYRNKFGLDLKIVRLFNTYGPYMDLNDGRVITNFINQIMKEENLKIYGDGTQTRSFCYVDDMIKGLVSMMESAASGPINLGNPNCEFTLNDLVAVFEKVVSKKLNVDYSDATQNDPKQRKPVIEKAQRMLGFNPTTEIEEGIQKTMEFFKKL
jgi:UDP-glucuronate decarboxylase